MATNGQANGRRTPSLSGLSLTEGSANSPPSASAGRIKKLLPDEWLLPTGHPDYLRLILTSRVYEACKETSLTRATNLSNRHECNVLLKREDEQPVFSFKLRGAYNKMAHLDKAKCWKGVVACSAGNHAQGVAYSARKLKIPATIVMPEGTPAIKHKAVSRMGGTVVLHGQDFDSAKEECKRLEEAHGLVNIPPFDDPYVIAGQGTIATELMKQTDMSKVEAIFCCVGGGGLIAGIGYYMKRVAPHVKIIGVETEDANAMYQSLQKGERVTLQDVGLFADGAAVKAVGEETFRICQEVVDEIVLVNTDETCAAIRDVFEDTRSIVEPAGALALAGLKKWAARNPSGDVHRSLIATTSGANMNFSRLGFVNERATIGEGTEALLSVSIPERPGSFMELNNTIMPHQVTEFNYRFATGEVANILLGLSLAGPAAERASELRRLLERLGETGWRVTDLSGNELAKSHLRFAVGGRSDVADERLYMFNFPERPGALHRFLSTLPAQYNISLFQYRNSGGDVGKVLTAIQCPEADRPGLETFLAEIGYPYEDCTEDPTFKTFLRS